jgi:cholesterol oxidase
MKAPRVDGSGLERPVSRRQLLGAIGALGVAGAAGVALPARAVAASTRKVRSRQPVVIIGSGYAGAVAALRLSQAGIKNIVLERGRRWPITAAGNTFATPAAPDGRAAWLSTRSPFTPVPLDVYVGVLEAFATNSVTALTGAGVGGGSLVNNAVMLQPDQIRFAQSFGSSLSYDEMATVWYPRARQLIGVAPMPDSVYNSADYLAARTWFDEAVAAGFQPRRCEMAMDWQTVLAEESGAAVASAILGYSIWGMNSGAKRSVDRTILAAAEATGHTTVRTLSRVVDVLKKPSGYQVVCENIDESGGVVDTRRYTARHVFLAAGSLGTSRLLVRAKARGSLPDLAEQVGSGWGTNGDITTIRYGMPDDNASHGGPSGVILQDWSNADEPVTMLNFPAHPTSGGGLAELGVTLVPPLGTFSYEPASDKVSLFWPSSDPRVLAAGQAVTATVDKLNAANPGTYTAANSAATTSHAVGGVGLGALDGSDGSLLGYPNLRVIDSSLLPGSTGAVPPALTVTALADRMVSVALPTIAASYF